MLLILLSSPVAAFPQLFAFPKLQREPTSTPYTAIFPANNSLQQILDINFIALDMAARIGKVDPSLKFSAFTKAAYDANGLKIAWNNFQLVRAGHPYVAPTSTDIRGPCPMLNTLANHGFINHNGSNITRSMIQDAAVKVLNFDPLDPLFRVFDRGFGESTDETGQTTLRLIAFHHSSITPGRSGGGRIVEHDSSISRDDSIGEGLLAVNDIIPQIPINVTKVDIMKNAATANNKVYNVNVLYKLRYDNLNESYRLKGKSGSNVAVLNADGTITNPNGFYFDNTLDIVTPNTNTEAFISFVEMALILKIMGGRYGEYANTVANPANNYAAMEFVDSIFRNERLPAYYLPPSEKVDIGLALKVAQNMYNVGPQQNFN